MANILDAIYRIVDNPILELKTFYQNRNRANAIGDALEVYVKDLFANTFNSVEPDRSRIHSQVFSWEGALNSPPDLILRGGDAIETKKIQTLRGQLQLNSSFPKNHLYNDDPQLDEGCRICEEWQTKDIIYIIGYTDDNNLKRLWMVYGDCLAANREIYQRVKNTIMEGINNIENIELAQTDELARINKVDHLKITSFRVRGMWLLDNPIKVYDYLEGIILDARFQLTAIMSVDKFNSFPEENRLQMSELVKDGYSIVNEQVKDPNNPMSWINCKIINYVIK